MTPECLAFSTALGDPLWFHEGTKDKGYKFIDKHGRLNGLRAEPFVPRLNLSEENACRGPEGCKHKELDIPWHCEFLCEYYKMLSKLDPQDIEQRFRKVQKDWEEYLNHPINPTFILLVYEAPSNPCSERVMLQKWLKEKGFGGEEWTKIA